MSWTLTTHYRLPYSRATRDTSRSYFARSMTETYNDCKNKKGEFKKRKHALSIYPMTPS
jgi:hypothetical protein